MANVNELTDLAAASPAAAREAAENPAADFPAEMNVNINDERFIKDLERLMALRSFLLQEAVAGTSAMNFGYLNLLKYSAAGRSPTIDEWDAVELHTQVLFGLLTEPLRRRFIFGEIPNSITRLPLWFVAGAIVALLAAMVVPIIEKAFGLHDLGYFISPFPFYILWLLCLGGLGSVAFIGMNALSLQQDITFDVTNSRLMSLRIVLGSLFALVLALPFGFPEFEQFINGLSIRVISSTGSSNPAEVSKSTTQAAMLLLPFVLGFSTSLVILILNQLISAIQTFFGRGGSTTTVVPTTSSPPPTSASTRSYRPSPPTSVSVPPPR